MANRLGKLQKLVYTPAIAPVAARDAYCITSTTMRSYSGVNLGDGIGLGGGGAAPVQPGFDFFNSSGTYLAYLFGYTPYTLQPITQKTCYPAIVGRAGTPAKVELLDNFAWDAGARSIEPVPGSGFFRARLPPSPVGVQIGLCLRGFASNYSEMQHSLVARRDQYSIVESGSRVFGPEALPASALIEVRRAGGTVTYRVNDAVVYESTTPSSGEIYGGALLYAVTDYADSPAVGELETPIVFSAELPSLVAAISEDADYSAAVLETPRLQLLAILDAVQGDIQFSASLPLMRAAISEIAGVAWMTASLPVVGLRATLGETEDIPSSFIGVTPPLVLSSNLRSGEAIVFSAELPLAFAVSDIADYAEVNAVLPLRIRINTREPYLPSDMVDGSDSLAVIDLHGLETALLLIGLDSMDVSGSAELLIVLEMLGMDSLDLSDSTSLGSIIEMLAIEQVSIMSHAGAARQQALQYAVNYLTGALSTYQDFDFIGFTQHAGSAYAWRADGLYRLGAESDAAIRLLADFGASDYADAHLKRAETAFVGVRTDGQCYARITADDGIERVYRLLGEGNQKRATLAKGVASRYWNLRLELTDASFATIDNVELAVGVTQRRGYSRSS